jgi:hypothetical protein
MEVSLSDAMLTIEEEKKKFEEATRQACQVEEEGKLRPRRHMLNPRSYPLVAPCRGILDTLT